RGTCHHDAAHALPRAFPTRRSSDLPLAGEYLRAVAWGLPAIATFAALRHLTEATSDAIPSVVIAVAASALNFVLDLGLIHGRFRSEEHTSELQSRENLVCRLLLEKK